MALEKLPAQVVERCGRLDAVVNSAYCASKAGLRAFAAALGEELRPRGIRVATVSPGPVDTDFFADLDRVADIVFSQPRAGSDSGIVNISTSSRTARTSFATNRKG